MAARSWFLVICSWLLVISSWFLAGTASAQTPLAGTESAAFQQEKETSITPQSPIYANLVVINLIHTFSCLTEGISIIGQPCVTSFETDSSRPGAIIPKTSIYASGGAFGSIAGLITRLYAAPPIHTGEYLADIGKGMGLVNPAYAQVTGSGSDVLHPVLEIWKLARNLSYIAMIFIFLVIGFMIMFRQKINPQTVISAQSALPSLVVGLILITFSYFLSALVVDVTFVSVHLAGKTLEGQIIEPGTTDKLLKSGNLLNLFDYFISPNGNELGTIISTTTNTVSSLKKDGEIGKMVEGVGDVGGCILATKVSPVSKRAAKLGASALKAIPIVGEAVGEIVGYAVTCAVGASIVHLLILPSGIPETFMGLILYVVLILALLIAMFKVLFALITSYISILINTITAPFQFLIGSIPGRQNALSGWLKSMLGNLLVFPAIFAALLFAAYLLNAQKSPFNIIAGPGSFTGTVPLLGSLDPRFLQVLFAYGILLMTPTIPEAIKGAFGVKDNQLFGKNILGGFMAGFGVAKTGAGAGWGALTGGVGKMRKVAEEQYFNARYETDPLKRAQMITALPQRFKGPLTWGIDKQGLEGTTPARAQAFMDYRKEQSKYNSELPNWQNRYIIWASAQPAGAVTTEAAYVAAFPGDPKPVAPPPVPEP